jgi:hypothetical protein
MKYPYIFIDTDTASETYLMYCLRVSESLSLDGYKTIIQALEALKNEI